jgi:hypothetical protein
MIYIIDDNRHNQMSQNYRIDFTKELQNYPKKVEWIKRITDSSINQIITQASCILIHDSVDEKESKEKLIAMVKEEGKVPYCIFSNGLTATIFGNNSILSIKKDRLYCNLIGFIQNYLVYDKIDLKLLALGVNYDLERVGILRDRLIEVLFVNRTNFNYESAFPSGSQAYKDLHEFHYLINGESDFSDFEEAFNTSDMTAADMRSAVLEMSRNVKNTNE